MAVRSRVPDLTRGRSQRRKASVIRPAAMYAPGDGRVTRASLLGENLIKSRDRVTGFTLSRYAVFGCDLHGQLPRNKSLQDNALTAIVSEAMN